VHELKRLTVEGIENAMRKAERCRLLGEPLEAESICVDVIEVDPGNHEARVLLILSLTDQFRTDLSRAAEAATLAEELEDEYERFYYSGIVAERLGKAQLTRSGPSSDDYAILRWNTCARAIARRGFTAPPDMSSSALVMLE